MLLCGFLRQTVDNLFDLIYDYGSTRQKQSTCFHLQITYKNVCWRAEGKEFGKIKEGRHSELRHRTRRQSTVHSFTVRI